MGWTGGNIAVLPKQDGKVLVDSGFAMSQQQISAALDNISNDPIRHLISTPWHFDHTDGNQWTKGVQRSSVTRIPETG
jgi:glyoxylase-like metal-dependent hydrolase (beta-lactamase superfamily II)